VPFVGGLFNRKKADGPSVPESASSSDELEAAVLKDIQGKGVADVLDIEE